MSLRVIDRCAAVVRRYSHVNWALSDQAVLSGVNFLIGILLARYLGAEEFGRYSLAWLVVLFANSMRLTLIVSPMMSLGPQQSEADKPGYYGAVFAQQLILGTLSSVLILGGASLAGRIWPQWGLHVIVWPLAFVAIAFQLQDHIRRHLFATYRPGRAFVHDALAYGIQIAALFLLFRLTEGSASSALWIIAGSFAIGALNGLLFLDRLEFKRANLIPVFLRHWVSSKWLVAMSLMQWVGSNTSTILAGILLGVADVGGLRVAAALIGVTNILIIGLDNVVPVRAATRYHEGGMDALAAYIRRVTLRGLVIVILVCAIAAVAPETWIGLLYGQQYVEYAYLLRGFALVTVIKFSVQPLASGLRAIENTRPIFVASFLATCFGVATAYPFVQLFGASGVVAVSGLVASIQVGTLAFVWRRTLAKQKKGRELV